MEGQGLAITLTQGVPSTSVHLPPPSSWSFGYTLGVAWEEWAGMYFSRAPQLSLS